MGNPFRVRATAMILAFAIAGPVATACAPVPSKHLDDPFFAEDAPSRTSGNFDEDEAQWRKEIAHERTADPDALLTDDPAKKPDDYGNVAFQDEPKKTFWENAGNATFAAATVAVTLGMMVAPYLLF